jgi:hypothetical protein
VRFFRKKNSANLLPQEELVFASIPVGNRTPYAGKNGLWPKDVTRITDVELNMWEKKVKDALIAEKVTSGLRGLYVGISAVFYAAAACSIDGRILPKTVFVAVLRKEIAKMLLDDEVTDEMAKMKENEDRMRGNTNR